MTETRFEHADVVVIGGGFAGLYASAQLCAAGRSVVLLEANSRLGGRILTTSVAGLAHPIELGAEFVHGQARLTRQLLDAAGLASADMEEHVPDPQEGVSTEHASPFDRAQRLMRDALSLPQDLSVEEFLGRYGDRGESNAYIRAMVEGFDAADPRIASAQAVAREWNGSGMEQQSRPIGGYAPLLTHLQRALVPNRVQVRLGGRAERVEWGGPLVRVYARSAEGAFTIEAARAVIALPLSMLKDAPTEPDQVRFEPPLEEKQRSLKGLAMGAVIKVVLHFRRAFWEELQQGRWREAGFLHAPDSVFSTFWTARPARVALLTAWTGGPLAQRLAGESSQTLIDQALQSAARLFGDAALVRREFLGGHLHNWGADPLIRGAYSYLAAGGGQAPEELARPLNQQLFFAGEATSTEHLGTVEGALQSGGTAAKRVLATGN